MIILTQFHPEASRICVYLGGPTHMDANLPGFLDFPANNREGKNRNVTPEWGGRVFITFIVQDPSVFRDGNENVASEWNLCRHLFFFWEAGRKGWKRVNESLERARDSAAVGAVGCWRWGAFEVGFRELNRAGKEEN